MRMMSKRDALARALDVTGVLGALMRLGRARPWMSLLTYHRVLPAEPAPDFPFDGEVVDATTAQFDAQVAMLKRHFRLVGVDELCQFTDGKRPPGNLCCITFDDGYRDNHDHALPILRKHGVRATFFVATTYISERRIFWWDQIAYIVKKSPRARIAVEYPKPIAVELGPLPRREAIGALVRPVKDEVALDLPRYLEALARAADVEWNEAVARRLGDEQLMTWDQVRALKAAGMDVQSHTRTHRVLHTLPPDELRGELEGSRLDLERELGAPCRAIAYPTGVPIVDDARLLQAVRDAGYAIGVTNCTGTNPTTRALSPFDVRRMSIDSHFTPSFFRALVALPMFAYNR